MVEKKLNSIAPGYDDIRGEYSHLHVATTQLYATDADGDGEPEALRSRPRHRRRHCRVSGAPDAPKVAGAGPRMPMASW